MERNPFWYVSGIRVYWCIYIIGLSSMGIELDAHWGSGKWPFYAHKGISRRGSIGGFGTRVRVGARELGHWWWPRNRRRSTLTLCLTLCLYKNHFIWAEFGIKSIVVYSHLIDFISYYQNTKRLCLSLWSDTICWRCRFIVIYFTSCWPRML